jgi:putative endonuclease
VTHDLERREKEHNSDSAKAAKYTRSRGPVRLIYHEGFDTLKEAMKREYEVKQWKKAKKERLVSGNVT